MPEALLLAAALLFSAGGIAWLALAMEVHWQQAHGSATGPGRRTATALRVLGSAALLASLVACLVADHATMAVLVWVMSLAASALLVALTLAWRPRWLAWLAPWARRA
ncbi:DUF3325 domain-containing protein [Rhizobacter sp. SG703]|uniref:DUF3325 domain-containing protein n=1 Tax=Rhizobacter sp. SG703 TaxID=2587140 RepID=UPI0014455F11|nr:DUF3325 domain-containing protein [Rhizobacter sp. SG703]NKI95512.1 hypothetical protein [Rhizobacter sp. SG703]